MSHKLAPHPETPSLIKASPYKITIERASWGMNCQTAKPTDQNNPTYLESDDTRHKIKENNVLDNVSTLCNGLSQCDVLINPNVLGEDPIPTCMHKILQVEYRCFSVDRLRKISAKEDVLSIDCDKQLSIP